MKLGISHKGLKRISQEYEDSWETWNGGECPVSQRDYVQIQLRDGYENEGKAGDFRWQYLDEDPDEADIVKYKVVEKNSIF